MLHFAFFLVAAAIVCGAAFAIWRGANRSLPAAPEAIGYFDAARAENGDEDPDAWSHFAEEPSRANIGAPQWREWHTH